VIARRSAGLAGDRLGVKVGTTVNWLLPDLHGSVAGSFLSNESGFTNALRYDPYGETLATWSGSGGSTPVGEKHWKYQGRLDVSPTALATPLYDGGARYYAPGMGAFTSLDTVAGSAQNPLSMNRFLFAEANPATMVDPTGHCTRWMDDFCADHKETASQKATRIANTKSWKRTPARWQMFEDTQGKRQESKIGPACSIARLNCALVQINNMSVKERKAWLQNLNDTYGRAGNFDGYFNNIQGILRFADEEGIMKPGSWEFWTDAAILGGIQDGLALRTGVSPESRSQNPGAAQWAAFFAYRASGKGVDDETSRHLWGGAEQTSTNCGTSVAQGLGAVANGDVKRTLITWGDKYRAAMADPELRHSYARNAGSKIGAAAGNAALPLGGGPVGFAVGWLTAPAVSDYLIDPQLEWVAHDLSAWIYGGGGFGDSGLGWLIGG
jgi:RHS repeat-associated protein